MPELRTLLAAVLGIGLGVLLVGFPDAAIRAHTAGRTSRDRGGGYGQESTAPARWRWGVRLIGLLVLAAGVYFAAIALAA